MIPRIICPYCDSKINLPAHIDFVNTVRTVRCPVCHGLFDYNLKTGIATARNSRTFYDIMGLVPDVADEVIKRRFRELIMRFHPDRDPLKSGKRAILTRQINEAYAALETPEKRAAYSAILAAENIKTGGIEHSEPDAAGRQDEAPSRLRRSWGWSLVALALIILFFAHHGVPIGLHEFGSYYTDRITVYNAPVIIRYLLNKRSLPEQQQ